MAILIINAVIGLSINVIFCVVYDLNYIGKLESKLTNAML